MKKVVIIIVAVVIGLTSSIGVYATGVDRTSNMDAETFLEKRLAIIDEALLNEEITDEDAIQIREHIQEVAENGTFGRGFENADREDCDFNSMFQKEVRLEKMDCSGNQDGTRGRGLGDGSGAGRGMGRGGACILN